MDSGVTLLEHYDKSEIVDVADSFCEASRFTLALASDLGLSSDRRSDEQIEIVDADLLRTKDVIDMLKTVESKKKSLMEVKYMIKQCQSFIEAEDIINANVHIKQCQSLEKIIDHVSLIIKESEQLRNRLQSPLMSDALNIHSSHHRYVLQLFSIISSNFKEFQFHLDTLNKGSRLDFRAVGSEHDVISLEAKKQIAELQMTVHYLEIFRSSLNKLYLIKSQNSSDIEMNINGSL